MIYVGLALTRPNQDLRETHSRWAAARFGTVQADSGQYSVVMLVVLFNTLLGYVLPFKQADPIGVCGNILNRTAALHIAL